MTDDHRERLAHVGAVLDRLTDDDVVIEDATATPEPHGAWTSVSVDFAVMHTRRADE